MAFRIEKMTPATWRGKGLAHYQAWQETYRGLMPDAYLSAQSPEENIRRAALLPDTTLVALDGGRVVGFVCYAPQAREFVGRPGASEIMALYLLREAQGQGRGRALMEAVLPLLPHREVALFVLKGNEQAIGFYRHMGFAFTGRELRQETGFGELIELEMLLKRPDGWDRQPEKAAKGKAPGSERQSAR